LTVSLNATTTAINTCKNLFDFGQREVNFILFMLVTNKGEHCYLLKVSKHWYNLNLTRACHRFYDLAPLKVLDPICCNG